MTRSRTKTMLAAVLVSALGVAYQQLSWGQAPSPEPASADKQLSERKPAELQRHASELRRQSDEIKQQAKEMAKEQQRIFKIARGGKGLDDQIRSAAEELRDSDGEEAKSKANDKLSELLDKYFEEDMKQREAAVTNLEQRLEKLKAQLDRRKSKKSEIVDLQRKIAVNEAEGLGFYSQPGFESFNFRMPIQVETPVIEPHFGDGAMILPPSQPGWAPATPAKPAPPADVE